MSWVHDAKSLRDFVSLVIVHAPDEFPEEDFLKPEEQLNLERAFVELRNGVAILSKNSNDPEFAQRLIAILDLAVSEYRSGNDVKGAHALHEFERKAFA